MQIIQFNKRLIAQFIAVLSALFLVHHYKEHYEDYYLEKHDDERNLLAMDVDGPDGKPMPELVQVGDYEDVKTSIAANLGPIMQMLKKQQTEQKVDDEMVMREISNLARKIVDKRPQQIRVKIVNYGIRDVHLDGQSVGTLNLQEIHLLDIFEVVEEVVGELYQLARYKVNNYYVIVQKAPAQSLGDNEDGDKAPKGKNDRGKMPLPQHESHDKAATAAKKPTDEIKERTEEDALENYFQKGLLDESADTFIFDQIEDNPMVTIGFAKLHGGKLVKLDQQNFKLRMGYCVRTFEQLVTAVAPDQWSKRVQDAGITDNTVMQRTSKVDELKEASSMLGGDRDVDWDEYDEKLSKLQQIISEIMGREEGAMRRKKKAEAERLLRLGIGNEKVWWAVMNGHWELAAQCVQREIAGDDDADLQQAPKSKEEEALMTQKAIQLSLMDGKGDGEAGFNAEDDDAEIQEAIRLSLMDGKGDDKAAKDVQREKDGKKAARPFDC